MDHRIYDYKYSLPLTSLPALDFAHYNSEVCHPLYANNLQMSLDT